MSIDEKRWLQDPPAEVLRVLCLPENYVRWRKMAGLRKIAADKSGDAIDEAIADIAEEAEAWGRTGDDPEEVGLRLVGEMGRLLDNWKKRDRRGTTRVQDADPDKLLPITPGFERARRRKMLQLHVVGSGHRFTDADVGVLLLEVGRIRLFLARLRAKQHDSTQQARYLAAEAMLEFDTARVCRVISRELAHWREDCRAEFDLYPRAGTASRDEEEMTARGLLGEPTYRPYVEWRLTGDYESFDEARLRPWGNLHSLRGDLNAWLKKQKEQGDALAVSLWETLHMLGRLHPNAPDVMVVMPRVRSS